jgi:DNA-binding MarR family transcriptional regulator
MDTATRRQLAVPDGNLILDLYVLQQRVGEFMETALAGTEVRPAEFAVFSQLGSGSLTPREIRLRLGVSASTLSGLLGAMQRRDDVRRTKNPEDGRSYRVELTTSGKARLRRCRTAFQDALTVLDTSLPQPADELRRSLLLIDEATEEAITRLRSS